MIEDISYLLENCEKDSTTIYVDSTDRNKIYNPTPSEYTLTFEQPFKLVNGFDILDAAIPTTMYNIDIYNNMSAFTIIKTALDSSNDPKTDFKQLSTSMIFSNIFEANIDTYIAVCNPSALQTYNISEDTKLTSKTTIVTPYYICIKRIINDKTVYQYKSLNEPDVYYIKYDEKYYGVQKTPENEELISILELGDYSIDIINNTFTFTYFTYYETTLLVYENIVRDNAYVLNIINKQLEVEIGNYDMNTLRNEMNDMWNIYDIFCNATTLVERKQGKIYMSSMYLIALNANKCNMATNLGFSLLPDIKDASLYEPLTIGTNSNVFLANYNADGGAYEIYAPGLVNLLSERFIILRCKEIEDHLLGSYAYMSCTPGIGMFKLAASYNDIANLRFDFVSLIRKPFHPIGKLNRLTLRFETSNGKMYDFKGVNHQILFVIKYLVPTQKMKFEKSVLNPNYDANFMRYMSTSKNIEYKEDSDKEEEFDTQHYYQMYKKEFEKYDYSTSEDEDDEEDEDDDSEEVLDD